MPFKYKSCQQVTYLFRTMTQTIKKHLYTGNLTQQKIMQRHSSVQKKIQRHLGASGTAAHPQQETTLLIE